jgi:hypothetical protein
VIAAVTTSLAVAWLGFLAGLVAVLLFAIRLRLQLKSKQPSLLQRTKLAFLWPCHVLRSSTWSSAADRRMALVARSSLLIGCIGMLTALGLVAGAKYF